MNLGSESETVEFKKSTGEHKEALQAMSATGQAPLSPSGANRSRPSPGRGRRGPGSPWCDNASRGYASRTLRRMPGAPDGGRLSSSLLSRRKNTKGADRLDYWIDLRVFVLPWHCGQRIAPANRGYRFAHNKNARRRFEWSSRARRRPLPLSEIVPLGRIPNGTIPHKRRAAA